MSGVVGKTAKDIRSKYAKNDTSMRLDELFNKQTNYQWTVQQANHAKGTFTSGEITYVVQMFGGVTSPSEREYDPETHDGEHRMPVSAPGYNVLWEVMFSARVPGQEQVRMDNTGTGDQYTVYSTVIAMVKDQMSKHGVGPIYMEADDSGRQSLYPRMLRKLFPSWKIQTSPYGEIAAIPPAK